MLGKSSARRSGCALQEAENGETSSGGESECSEEGRRVTYVGESCGMRMHSHVCTNVERRRRRWQTETEKGQERESGGDRELGMQGMQDARSSGVEIAAPQRE